MKIVLVVKKDDINSSGGQPLWDIWESAQCIGDSEDGEWKVLLADSSCLASIGVSRETISGLAGQGEREPVTVARPGEKHAGQKSAAAGMAKQSESVGTEQSGKVRLHPARRTAYVGNTAIELKNREFQLLYHLVSNPEKIFSKQELYEEIWGEKAKGNLNTVTVHINRIRSKIEKNPSKPRYIQTVWGIGYRFKI